VLRHYSHGITCGMMNEWMGFEWVHDEVAVILAFPLRLFFFLFSTLSFLLRTRWAALLISCIKKGWVSVSFYFFFFCFYFSLLVLLLVGNWMDEWMDIFSSSPSIFRGTCDNWTTDDVEDWFFMLRTSSDYLQSVLHKLPSFN